MARAACAGLFILIIPFDFSCSSGNNCTWLAFTTLGGCSECNDRISKVNVTCNTNDAYDICWYQLIGPGDLPGNSTYPGRILCHLLVERRREYGTNRRIFSATSYRFPKATTPDLEIASCPWRTSSNINCSIVPKTFDSAAVIDHLWIERRTKCKRHTCAFQHRKHHLSRAKLRKANQQRRCKVPSERTEHVQRRAMILGRVTFFGSTKKIDHQMTANMLNPLVHQKAMSVDGNGGNYLDDGGTVGAGTDAITTAFWDNHEGNISLTSANITTAMTNRVRLTDGYENIDGNSTSIHTLINVTWYWLIYILAIVIFSLVFFVTAMVFSSERSKAVWKSSSLAVLMHGLEGFDGTQLDYRSLTEMSKEAEKLWAQLKEDDEGNLKLVQYRS